MVPIDISVSDPFDLAEKNSFGTGRTETVRQEFGAGRKRRAADQPERSSTGAVRRRAGRVVAVLKRGPRRRAVTDHHHPGDGAGPRPNRSRAGLDRRRLRGHARAAADAGHCVAFRLRVKRGRVPKNRNRRWTLFQFFPAKFQDNDSVGYSYDRIQP